jgi:hypothetical protein
MNEFKNCCTTDYLLPKGLHLDLSFPYNKLLASDFCLLRWNEDKVKLEELEGLAIREPSESSFFLVIYDFQILPHG